ncbi:MAG: glycosyltransferase [Patescibacteria group bacterium]|mgnify:CR=1 FL=1
MKIALIHEWLTSVAGSERVLLEMTRIFPQAPIYTSVFNPKAAAAFADKDVRTSFLQRVPLARRREILVPLTPLAFEQFDLSEFDVVISSTHMAAKGVITKPGTISIAYCHTPPRYLWEPRVDPRANSGRLAWLRRKTAHNLRLWDRVAAERVDHYIANSYYIAQRIKKYYKKDSTVIYPPVEVEKFQPAGEGEVGDHYLFVSRLIGYKKADLVIEAFNRLGYPLKVIGQGPERRRLMRMAKSNIDFLGFLSDDELGRYYARAKAFVFPAEEDFGLVPVEAMAAGRPVLAYTIGGAAETVVPGETGELFSEQTSESLAAAVAKFDPGRYDPAKIRRHALNFSAERFRQELETKVKELVKTHRNNR